MPSHYIEISLPTKPIRNVDTTIGVWSDVEGKLGELRISKGSLDWVPSGSNRPRRMSWENVALLFENHRLALKAVKARKRR